MLAIIRWEPSANWNLCAVFDVNNCWLIKAVVAEGWERERWGNDQLMMKARKIFQELSKYETVTNSVAISAGKKKMVSIDLLEAGLSYRFLKRQVRWSGIPISFRIFRALILWWCWRFASVLPTGLSLSYPAVFTSFLLICRWTQHL